MKKRYIAIEREYGSGGTEIARRISSNTGIPCYGKQIIERAAQNLHLTMEEVEKYEENVTGSFMYTIYMMAQANTGSTDMLTRAGEIFVAEQEEIQRLAKEGSAIFLGHCASEALKEEDGVIKVFIRCSDNRQKQERIQRTYGISPQEVDYVRERFDKKRANYYQANTKGKWRDYSNYDIVLDSGTLGIDGCAGVLAGLLF
jgi:cytidylate kinase